MSEEFVINSLVGKGAREEMVRLAWDTPEGCFVELGVYQGGSAYPLYLVAEEQGRKLFLYDTFTGIPYKSSVDSHEIGDFRDTSAESVSRMMPKATVVQGIFPFSVVKMPPIAFCHIDADQYDSIRMAIWIFGPRMVKGGIMWFDDVGCLDGANKAYNEWVKEENIAPYKAESGKFYVRF
jgi:O-methyltransferase